MVAPLIAIGAYELIAAGAAGTGAAAVAIARRKGLAEGLGTLAETASAATAEMAVKALPWIMAPVIGRAPTMWRYDTDTPPLPITEAGGLDLDIGAIQPWAPPIVHIEAPSVLPTQPVTAPLRRIDGGAGEPPPPGQDPKWRELLKAARDAAARAKDVATQVGQNPWVQGAGTLYRWYIYASTVLTSAEIGRRMATGSKDHGPILYDYVYEPLFGEAVAARTILGAHQVMAAETTTGTMAIALASRFVGGPLAAKLGPEFVTKFLAQLPSFGAIHAMSALGNLAFFEHQMTANDVDLASVDIDRATRTAGFFGFTSTFFYPLVGILSNVPRITIGRFSLEGIGRIGFREWWMKWGTARFSQAVHASDYGNWAVAQLWHGAQWLLGKQVSQVLAPHYMPSFRTYALYAIFATVYRNGTQAIASLSPFENSNISESMAMTNVRNVTSIALFDHYLYLCAKGNSARAIFGAQLIFMGLIGFINQFFSPFDGEDVAVNEADRALQKAAQQGEEGVRETVLSKPLTQRNFLVPPYMDLSTATWAQLSSRYATAKNLDKAFFEQLASTMQKLLLSKDVDERRVGMALGVLLTQVSFNPKWQSLQSKLHQAGVVLDPSRFNRPLAIDDFEQVFEEISDGVYDKTPLFRFPLN
ncbi:MAG: hypothetical protein COV45_00280 [Deltaproteobacteria bacterium CG11_big_fil_rev_8_21_14_0_20_47_16]|nr:MAG: hypothetical protein COV45_00280 [Deltaproteobacteria bacterium CG11_big_fil_rev_8_21_14_0_20_47_16]